MTDTETRLRELVTNPERFGYFSKDQVIADATAMLGIIDELREEKRRFGVHLSHCNFGEHVKACKYGDEDCPALSPSWSWFGEYLTRAFRHGQEVMRELAAQNVFAMCCCPNRLLGHTVGCPARIRGLPIVDEI
jgi:hypothetical protein